jgi:hypothetical protein
MSDCACVYVGDLDGPEFHFVKKPTARKPHKCGECDRDIEPGEIYERGWGIWDGCLDTHKTCLDCVSVRTAFFCDGWLYGGIWERLHEHIDEMQGQIASDCILPLTARAREKVFEIIGEVWAELEKLEADD